MKKDTRQLLLLPEFQKFIIASSTGRRLMPSGKKIRSGTIEQYRHTYSILEEFGKDQEPLRIQLLHRSSLRAIQKEKNYWSRFFKRFSSFLYKDKNYYDQYTGSVFKVIKVLFHYLSIEKAFPVGDFHKRFRVPTEHFTPAILSPAQLRFLIIDKAFEESLPKSLQRTKDIFVFGCTVALRYKDLMALKKINIQYAPEGTNIILHTQKTGAELARAPAPLPRSLCASAVSYTHLTLPTNREV